MSFCATSLLGGIDNSYLHETVGWWKEHELPLTQAGQNLHFSNIFDFFDGDSSVSSSSSESNTFTENVNK